jgi:hypothetical protein
MNWIINLFKKPKDKFEFIENIEIRNGGEFITYYTRKNGFYVGNSLFPNKEEAFKIFERLSNGEKLEFKTALETKYL